MRKIIHVDMDAFFAAVEQRNHPELKGKPVIVGGDPDKRGVVSTCSYEARKFGIHSAMASSLARKLCPQAIFIKSNFSDYREVSNQIREIFFEYTDLVEPLSLDEAYLDVTENKFNIKSATIIAEEIRTKVFQKTQLTCSAGVSFNKFLAKVASDINKPNGICVVTPAEASDFINKLPIRKFYGVGKATEKHMKELGIHYGKDLKLFSLEDLVYHFGKSGFYYYKIAHGEDDRPVQTHYERKSLGKERTYAEDILDKELIESKLIEISDKVFDQLTARNLFGNCITIKVKYYNFTQITRSRSFGYLVSEREKLSEVCLSLLQDTEYGRIPIRLLGVSVSGFDLKRELLTEELPKQLYFDFGDDF
ncbi:MAG: DNA polymerase IV [Candidatus Delongbacteria bacterium]|nr:DNA polymerase IV [Candidatus Delongbacteria bacterium]MBN2834873.1 DNA polymerase IV [Candidatus Delongbacteria bacterium]